MSKLKRAQFWKEKQAKLAKLRKEMDGMAEKSKPDEDGAIKDAPGVLA